MYWRVQKISVEQLAKAYAVYLVCLISVMLNFVFILNMPNKRKLNVQQRTDFDAFARQVAQHLYDANFMTYKSSMERLALSKKPELSGSVIKSLTPNYLPESMVDFKAQDKMLHDSKSVSEVAVDEVKIADQPDANGLVPIEMLVRIVKSATGEVTGPLTVRFKLYVTTVKNKGTDEEWTQVVGLQWLEDQPTQPSQQQQQ